MNPDIPTSQNDLINYKLDEIKKEMGEMKEAMKEGAKELKDTYVTKTEFGIIQKIVYGMVGVILTAFLVAAITLVLRSYQP